jgi:phosphatidate phosphatase APP1
MSGDGRNWQAWTARLARSVERRVDEARTRVLGEHLARQVVPYRGFGTAEEVFISGRVLANPPRAAASADDRWWRNLATTLSHLESDEVVGAHVHVAGLGDERIAITDEEGFFRTWLQPRVAPGDTAWHDVHVRVLDRTHPSSTVVSAAGAVLVPPASAQFGVISDIDDTVIRTDSTRLLPMLRKTLLENARTRLPFPGVAAFYTALHEGQDGNARNPIFYVSSSPWNLYPVLIDFLEHQDIPAGPLMLRDWGITDRSVLPTGHAVHKLGAIRQILEQYPGLPFILIGDSGQEDPEIYREVVHDVGERILAVYIRNVTTDPRRAEAIGELSEEVRLRGSVLLLSDDTTASTRHAAQRGWIRQECVDLVEREVSSSAARPG